MKILVTSDCEICPEALDPLREVGEVAYRHPPDPDQVREELGEYTGWLCHTQFRVDETMIERATNLKVIATCSTGTDPLDKPALARHSIQLLDQAKEYELLEGFTATAEGAWALLLAAVRRLPRDFERAKRGCIGPADPLAAPHQLSGKTLGIVGCGRLGRMVAEYGRAFRMRVLAFDIQALDIPGVEQVDLDTLLSESDVVSLHLHLKDETEHIISRDRLDRMKRGAVIINTARGDLVDEAALIDALTSGQIGAAGLDVVHNEWDPHMADRPLMEYARTHDNLIITPHVASFCVESVSGSRIFMARKLADALRHIAGQEPG